MNKLLLFVMTTVFGYVGWLLGEGVGLMTAFLLSSVGSGFGIYVAWRIDRDYL